MNDFTVQGQMSFDEFKKRIDALSNKIPDVDAATLKSRILEGMYNTIFNSAVALVLAKERPNDEQTIAAECSAKTTGYALQAFARHLLGLPEVTADAWENFIKNAAEQNHDFLMQVVTECE